MTDVARRDALKLSGLAAAPALLRPSLALSGPKIVIGVNHDHFPQFARAIPGASGVRIYYDTYGQVPGQWPNHLPSGRSLLGGAAIPPGTHTVLSIRPMPSDLFSGKLDHQIRSLALSAPPGSALTAWHENEPGNPLHYPREVNNRATAAAIHERMHRLCRRTNAKYGSIICAPAKGIMPWLGNHLDWYGLDTYCFSRYRRPDGTVDQQKWLNRMHENRQAWQRVSGRMHPTIKICETNASHDRNRSTWFTMVAAWLAAHNGNTMLTYWNHTVGSDSGPWPPSEGVKDRLQALTRKYGTRNWR